MQKIVTAIGNADIELGDTLLLLLPVLGVGDHARELALYTGFLLLDTSVGIERRMQGAIGEGRERGDTQINPDLSTGSMHGLRQVHLDLERHKPMFPLSGDGDVLDGACNLTAMPKLNPAKLGQVDLAPIQLETLRIAEAVGEELLAVLRRGRTASKEIGVGAL